MPVAGTAAATAAVGLAEAVE